MQRVCARLLATRGLSQSTPLESHILPSATILFTNPRYYSTPTTDLISDSTPLFFSQHAASLIDHLHTTTGLPWWATLASIAALTRTALFPLSLKATKASLTLSSLLQTARDRANQEVNAAFIHQAMKDHQDDPGRLRELLELKNLPEKPGPQHIARHLTTLIKHRKKNSNNSNNVVVSPLWMLAAPLIQLPIFITTMTTVRHMSLSNWPGFSTGGALWFPDLTLPAVKLSQIVELNSNSSSAMTEAVVVNMTPMGIAGIILPACVLFSTFITIQTNFKTSNNSDDASSDSKTAVTKSTMMTDVLRSVFEIALIPVSLITLFLPQGTLCYWATSSSLALLQSRVMKNSSLRDALGVVPPPMDRTLTAGQIEVLNTAAQLTANGQHRQGIEVLIPLLKQSNNHPRVLFALGTMHSSLGEWQQAAACFVKSAESHDDVYLQARAWLAAVPGLLSGGGGDNDDGKELERAEMALERAKKVLNGDGDVKMIGELEQVLRLKRQKEEREERRERRGG